MVEKTSLRLASIDIGSNAIRLFIGQKTKSGRMRVLEDQRASVRLGKDAFSAAGFIRKTTQAELVRAMKDFREICDDLKVDHIRAVGTSALRDSANGRKVIELLKLRTGIQVHLIDGRSEAALLHRAVSQSIDLSGHNALLADMGGGSLEIVLSRRGRLMSKHTLPLGTVRLLNKVERKPRYEDIAKWARTPLYKLRLQLLGLHAKPIDLMIGTGGNLRALGKLCYRLGLSRSRNRFEREHLEILVLKLFQMSLSQRAKRFQLKPDRVDVILPAGVVMLELMRIFEIEEMQVPNVGLKNGLFWDSLDRVKFKRPRRA